MLSLPIQGALEGENGWKIVAALCSTVAGSGQGLREPGRQGGLPEGGAAWPFMEAASRL